MHWSITIELYTNRKRFPCFHRVLATRVKFGRTINSVETRAAVAQQFRVLPNFHECYHNSVETQGIETFFYCFIFPSMFP